MWTQYKTEHWLIFESMDSDQSSDLITPSSNFEIFEMWSSLSKSLPPSLLLSKSKNVLSTLYRDNVKNIFYWFILLLDVSRKL